MTLHAGDFSSPNWIPNLHEGVLARRGQALSLRAPGQREDPATLIGLEHIYLRGVLEVLYHTNRAILGACSETGPVRVPRYRPDRPVVGGKCENLLTAGDQPDRGRAVQPSRSQLRAVGTPGQGAN